MVDVGGKPATHRRAVAEGVLTLSPQALSLLAPGANPKGDALAVARIAGIQAAKRTADLIPLCHPLPLTRVAVEIEAPPPGKLPAGRAEIRVTATVETHARTGVEMEALTAVTGALLALYDMLKSADRTMSLTSVRLLEKTGGRSGAFHTTATRD